MFLLRFLAKKQCSVNHLFFGGVIATTFANDAYLWTLAFYVFGVIYCDGMQALTNPAEATK